MVRRPSDEGTPWTPLRWLPIQPLRRRIR